MEPKEPRDDHQGQRTDSPRGDISHREGGPGPSTEGNPLDRPDEASIPANILITRGVPDRTTVIKASASREPSEDFDRRMVLVSAASAPSDRSELRTDGVGQDERDSGDSSQQREGQGKMASKTHTDSDHGRVGASDHPRARPDHPARQPSLTRILLYTSAVALVSGVVGAWAYTHFLGSSVSGRVEALGESSGSRKSSGSNEGSGSAKSPDSEHAPKVSSNGLTKGDLLQSQTAWLAAIKKLKESEAAEQEARRSARDTMTILDFFKRTLLSGGRTADKSLSDTFWSGGRGQDFWMSKALDESEALVASEFSDRPLVEAAIREILGQGYLNVGKPERSAKEFERALALREAIQGASDPDTAACRNQLAVAYRLAGKTVEAGKLFDQNPNSTAGADALAARGAMLLIQKKPAEAEVTFRKCLSLREKLQADDWSTFDTMSYLGEALLDQKKYADAEPFLLSGYEGMSQRESSIPAPEKPRLTRAISRLVRLYDAWGKRDDAMNWRKKLAAAEPPASRSS